ncbi:hypothetical protein HDU67_005405 [Dinochytrium kinnereticum]|nr:hypothetical protein HDU67_005405 [Dinochytrium kinnereticum]
MPDHPLPSQKAAKYFNTNDIHCLRQYKYKSIDKSFIANRILNPYWWTPLVKPQWEAGCGYDLGLNAGLTIVALTYFLDWPNVITLSGFSFVVINLITLLWFAPSLTETVPSWAYYSFAVGLFLYQSFDAIDGKQARRTGTSGPLGELFDHGCDALNTGLGSIVGANALGVGPSGWLVFTLMSTLSNFYLSTWEEYHTGVLYLSYCSGPVEGLLSVCFVFIVTAIYGNQVWNNLIGDLVSADVKAMLGWVAEMQINHAFIYFAAVVVVFNIVSSGYNVIVARRSNRRSLLPPFLGILPLIFFVALSSYWAFASPTIIPTHIVPYAIAITFLQGHHVGSIIVAHVAKRPFPFIHLPTLIVLPLGIAVSWGVRAGVLGTEEWGIWGAVGIAVWMYVGLVRRVVGELCEIFGIYCLRVGKRGGGEGNVGVIGEGGRRRRSSDSPIARRTRSAMKGKKK